jgi:predicted nuclease of predicted toxin-antitoxin system
MSPGLPDDKVVGLALQEVRVLLAEDKDFGQLVFASASPSPGVIFLRYPALMRQSIARAVVEYVANNKDKIAKRFTVVQPGRIRVSANADLSR